MAHVFQEGDISVHIAPGNTAPVARCYDLRDEGFRTVVTISLLGFLPLDYGEEEGDDNRIPSWEFVVEAMRSCAARGEELWAAWEVLKQDQLF